MKDVHISYIGEPSEVFRLVKKFLAGWAYFEIASTFPGFFISEEKTDTVIPTSIFLKCRIFSIIICNMICYINFHLPHNSGSRGVC